jgi:hypothetical protein
LFFDPAKPCVQFEDLARQQIEFSVEFILETVNACVQPDFHAIQPLIIHEDTKQNDGDGDG